MYITKEGKELKQKKHCNSLDLEHFPQGPRIEGLVLSLALLRSGGTFKRWDAVRGMLGYWECA